MNKATILVIDDQATALRVMERMLTDDYVVLTADSGERGLDIGYARTQWYRSLPAFGR
jgi:response regulator RpfG family c-di-GMP phosphodiesterase